MTDKDLEALSPLSRALLELERTRPAPSDMPDVVWGKVGATLGLTLPPAPSATGNPGPARPAPSVATMAASSAAVVGAGKLGFGVAMLMLGGLLGGGVVTVVMKADQRAQAVPEKPANPAAPASPPERPREPEPTTTSSTNEVPAATAGGSRQVGAAIQRPLVKTLPTTRTQLGRSDAGSVEAKSEGDSNLKAERGLVEVARTALARHNVGEAMGLLSRHETEFPNGQLAEERESLWIQCLVNSGKGAEARIRADDFRRRFPRSILLPAVDAVVESISVTDSEAHPK